MSDRVPLPRTIEQAEGRAAFLVLLELVGREVSSLCQPMLADEYGQEWPLTLQRIYLPSARHASPIDLSLLLKEVLRQPGRSGIPKGVCRSALSRDAEWLDTARRVLRLRHEVAHPDDQAAGWAVRGARDLVALTSEVGLECAPDCGALLTRLLALREGTWKAVQEEPPELVALRVLAEDDLARIQQLEADMLSKDERIAELERVVETSAQTPTPTSADEVVEPATAPARSPHRPSAAPRTSRPRTRTTSPPVRASAAVTVPGAIVAARLTETPEAHDTRWDAACGGSEIVRSPPPHHYPHRDSRGRSRSASSVGCCLRRDDA